MKKPDRIFISHSALDREFVEREIVSLFDAHDIPVWYSQQDIHASSQWHRKIQDGLEQCDWFLVALSPRSVTSSWVEAEVHWALEERQGRVVPVLVEDCVWKHLHLKLRTIQHVDLSNDVDDGKRRLLQTWGVQLAGEYDKATENEGTPAKTVSPKKTKRAASRTKAATSKKKDATRKKAATSKKKGTASKKATTPKKAAATSKKKATALKKAAASNKNAATTRPRAARAAASTPAMPRPRKNVATANESGEVIKNSIGMQLKLLRAGEFLMGSSQNALSVRNSEEPQHPVQITKPFYLGVYEVTQQQYEKLMGTRPWRGKKYVREGADCPAVCVSWHEAAEFCRKLSEQEGGEYYLPTEAQWEYGCRAGTKTEFSFGDDASKLGRYAWYNENAWDAGEKYAHRVGQKLPNSWGLHDMHGNVWEWCSDWYGEYKNAKAADPSGADSGDNRILRGGSFYVEAGACRSAIRFSRPPDVRDDFYGFRVSRNYT